MSCAIAEQPCRAAEPMRSRPCGRLSAVMPEHDVRALSARAVRRNVMESSTMESGMTNVPAAVRSMFCHSRGPLSRQCENCEKDACNNQPYYSIGSIPKAREKMYKEQGKSEGNPMDSP